MTPSDYPEFYQAWVNSHAMSSSNQTPSDSTVMAVFDLLAEYPLPHVLGALQVHSRKSRFAPTPHDVCEIIDSRTKAQHLGADEAWTIALSSFDESETVVWTAEIAEARDIAYQQFLLGDKIGARMAFREAYSRIIANADAPRWQVCAGWDVHQRIDAVEKAKRLGRLPESYSINPHLLPAPEAETTVSSLLLQLEHRAERTEVDAQAAKRGIARIKAMLAGDDVASGIEQRQKQRDEFERHRQRELSRLAEKAGELH